MESLPTRKPFIVRNCSTGDISKSWNFVKGTQKFKVQLRHNVFSFLKVVYVDGEEVARESFHGPVDRPNDTTLPFRLGDSIATITIKKRSPSTIGKLSNSFDYECEVKDTTIKFLDGSVDYGAEIHPFHISIPSTSVICEGGRKTNVYNVRAKSSSVSTTVQRRYSEFVKLNDVIRTSFKGSHLLSSLPALPSKTFRWKNQLSGAFVEHRRTALECYLSRLAGIPRAANSPEFLVFLDLDPVSGLPSREQLEWQEKQARASRSAASFIVPAGFDPQEIVVTFTEIGPLGLDISLADTENDKGPLVVTDLKSCGVTPENYRVALESICRGYAICKLDGQSTLDWSVEQMTEFAKQTSRPLEVHFLRPLKQLNDTIEPQHSDDGEDACFPRLR